MKINDDEKELNKQIFKRCIEIFDGDSWNKNQPTNEETFTKLPIVKTRKFVENEVVLMNFQDFIEDREWGVREKGK